jgi:hypothetical protein
VAVFLFPAIFHNARDWRVIGRFPADISALLHPLKYEAEKCVSLPAFLRRIYRISVM